MAGNKAARRLAQIQKDKGETTPQAEAKKPGILETVANAFTGKKKPKDKAEEAKSDSEQQMTATASANGKSHPESVVVEPAEPQLNTQPKEGTTNTIGAQLLGDLEEALADDAPAATPEKPETEAPAQPDAKKSGEAKAAPPAEVEPTQAEVPATPETPLPSSDQLCGIVREMVLAELEPIRAEQSRINGEIENLYKNLGGMLKGLNKVTGAVEDLDLQNAEAVYRYAVPATQTAFDQLVKEFWEGPEGWKAKVAPLLQEILNLKTLVHQDDSNRAAILRAMTSIELLAQLPEVAKRLKELIAAGEAIEKKIAGKVAELKALKAGEPASAPTAASVPASRFAPTGS